MKLKMIGWQSLKTRLMVIVLCIFVLCIWSLTLISSQIMRGQMEKTLRDQQFSTVSLIAEVVNDEILERMQALQLRATDVQSQLLQNPEQLQHMLEDKKVLQKMFNGGLFITDANGVALASIPSSLNRVGLSFMDRDFIIAALKEGKTTVGKPVIGKKLYTPIVVIAAPISDPGGKIIGAYAGVINLDEPNFFDKIVHHTYGKTGGYFLVSRQHRLVVTATDKSRIMRPVPAKGVNPVVDSYIDGGESSDIFINPRGFEVLSSTKQIPAANWYIAASIPTSEVLAPVKQTQQKMVLVAMLLTLLAGSLIWWALRRQMKPLRDASDQLQAYAEFGNDYRLLPIHQMDEIGILITGFNQLLSQLSVKEQIASHDAYRYSALLEFSIESIVVHRAGKIIFVNPAAITLFGAVSAEELIGLVILDRIHPDCHALAIGRAREIKATNHRVGLTEIKLLKLDGSVFEAELQTAPILYEDQRAYHTSIIDITERKQVERIKSEFISTVSHELRTPITSIRGSLGLLEAGVLGSLPDKARDIVKVAHKNSVRLSTLVNDILDMEKLMSGKMVLHLEALDLLGLVEESLQANQAYADSYKVQYQFAPVMSECRVHADKDRLMQVMANLLSNAAKFSHPPVHSDSDSEQKFSSTVEIRVLQDADALFWRVEVEDHGDGIPEEFQSRIFEAFAQAENTNTRRQGGTGLGLNISQKLIREMQGDIGYFTRVGAGTVFWFSLPKLDPAVLIE